MRRLAWIFATFLGFLVLTDHATASVPANFQAQFTQHFGRGVGAAGGSCAEAFCGSGQVVGYGEAELTIVVASVVPASVAHCGFALAVSGTATIELEDDSTLVLDETGTYCLPGGSHFAPGNFFVSYGNPLEIEATYTVVGGSGVFAGAAGAGTNSIHQAGDTQMAIYWGTLSFG